MFLKTDQIESYLGNSSPESAGLIALACEVICKKVNEYLYGVYTVEESTVTVNKTVYGARILLPCNVQSVSKVELRLDKTTYQEIDAVHYESDELGVKGFRYTFGGEYRITFVGGWAEGSIPGTITEVALHEIKRFVEGRPDLISKNQGGQSQTGESYIDLDPVSKKKLQQYKRWAF